MTTPTEANPQLKPSAEDAAGRTGASDPDGTYRAPSVATDTAPPHAEDVRIVRRRHPGQWLSAAIVLLLAAALAHSMVTNPRFQWSVVGQYLTAGSILSGIRLTLLLTVIAMGIGFALGIVLATARLSINPVLSSAASLYIWFFRGTPVLVQLIFWYNLAALYPHISLGIPFGPVFVSASANALISPMAAAILGLGLNEGAYMAEIVRGGILSVDYGQTLAGEALAMSRITMMRRIILPQAMRSIIPPTGNEVISMVKGTALVSVIALADLLYSTELIYDRTYQTIPLLIVASIWYLVIITILSVLQMFVERHFARGHLPTRPRRSFLAAMSGNLRMRVR
jgi:polar amino acid transport system permease protein